jgi:hypothetical protein
MDGLGFLVGSRDLVSINTPLRYPCLEVFCCFYKIEWFSHVLTFLIVIRCDLLLILLRFKFLYKFLNVVGSYDPCYNPMIYNLMDPSPILPRIPILRWLQIIIPKLHIFLTIVNIPVCSKTCHHNFLSLYPHSKITFMYLRFS